MYTSDMSTATTARPSLGECVKRARERRGMSVSELARRAGVTRQTVYAAERDAGRVYLETFVALARGLGLTAAELLEAGACAPR